MRRRFHLILAAAAAASIAVAGLVPAASGKSAAHGKAKKPEPVALSCHMAIATQPPAGSNAVDQPAQQGNQYGPVHCPRKGFGGGVTADSFTVPDNGDMVGTYTEFLRAGTISGRFDLAPEEGQPITGENFASQSWVGTLTVTGGTGVYQGIKAKRGSGKLTCTSPDSVHLSCSERIRIALPAQWPAGRG